MRAHLRVRRLSRGIALLMGLVVMAATCCYGQQKNVETIDATAMGTSTQMGRNFTMRLMIFQFSAPEDREVLVQAFAKGQNEGLVKALDKMKPVGRITIPGTLGYEVSYIRQIITPTGRTIRFMTNRTITFGESYRDARTKSFDITAGEIVLNDENKKKNEGTLFPAAQLIVNKQGELQFELNQNAWKLTNIIEWK